MVKYIICVMELLKVRAKHLIVKIILLSRLQQLIISHHQLKVENYFILGNFVSKQKEIYHGMLIFVLPSLCNWL